MANNLFVNLIAQIDDFLRNMNRAESGTKRALDGIKNAAAGLLGGIGVAELSRQVIDATRQLETIQKQLQLATGSAQGAADALAFVRQEADRLGIVATDAARGLAQIEAAAKGSALEGDSARQIFLAVSEASAAMSLSSEATEGIFLAMAQAVGKQKLQMEEVLQVTERGINLFPILQKVLGLTGEELAEAFEQGAIGLDVLPKLAAEMRRTFGGETTSRVQGLTADINRLTTAWDDFLVVVGDSGPIDIFHNIIITVTDVLGDLNKILADSDKDARETAAGFEVLNNALRGIIVAGLGAVAVLASVGKLIGASKAAEVAILSGEFSQAATIINEAFSDVGSIFSQAGKDIDELVLNLDHLEKGTESTGEVIEVFGERTGLLPGALKKLREDLDPVAKSQAKLKEQTEQLDKALSAGQLTQSEYTRLLGLAKKEYDETVASANKLSDAAKNQAKTFKELVSDLATLVEKLDPLADAQAEFAKETAILDKALSAVDKTTGKTLISTERHAELTERLRTELQRTLVSGLDPIVDAQIEYQESTEKLTRAQAAGIITAERAAALIEKLRKEYERIIDPIEEYTKNIQDEIRLAGIADDTELEVQRTLAELRREYEALGKELPATAEAQVRAAQQMKEQAEFAAEATDRFTLSAGEFREAWLSALDSVGDAITDGLVDGFDGAGATIKDLFNDLLRYLIRQALVNPILLKVSGIFGGTGTGATAGAGGGFSFGGFTAPSGLLGKEGVTLPGSLGGGTFTSTFATNPFLGGAGTLAGSFAASALFPETTGIGASLGAVAGSFIPIPGVGQFLGAIAGAAIEEVITGAFSDDDVRVAIGTASDRTASALRGTRADLVQRSPFGFVGFARTEGIASDKLTEIIDAIVFADQQLAAVLLPAQIDAIGEALDGFVSRVEKGSDDLSGLNFEDLIRERNTVIFDVIETSEAFAADVREAFSVFRAESERSFDDLVTAIGVLQGPMAEIFGTAGILGALEAAASGTETLLDVSVRAADVIADLSSEGDLLALDIEAAEEAVTAFREEIGELGFSVGSGRDALLDFAKALDLTSEAGQQAFAAVLDVADSVGFLEDTADELADFMRGIEDDIASFTLSDFAQELREIDQEFDDNIESARALGASVSELARIEYLAALQLDEAIRIARDSIADLADELFGSGGSVSRALGGGGSSSSGGSLSSVADEAQEKFDAAQSALERIGDTLAALSVSDLSGLSPREQLEEARRQYDEAITAALAGDAEAAEEAADLVETVLNELKDFSASRDLREFFEQAEKDLAAIEKVFAAIEEPAAATTGGGGGGGGGGGTTGTTRRLLDTQALARDLAIEIGDLGLALDESVFDLAKEFGFTIRELGEKLGIDFNTLDLDLVEGLKEFSALLRIGFIELAEGVGVDLKALARNFGLDIDTLDGNLARQLVKASNFIGETLLDVADALDIDLVQLGRAIGVDLDALAADFEGEARRLADRLGIDFDDLIRSIEGNADTIARTLGIDPAIIQNLIDALPAAVSDGISVEIDSLGNVVSGGIEDVVSALQKDVATGGRELLSVEKEVRDLLREIRSGGASLLSATNSVRDNLRSIARNLTGTSFQAGTGFVPRTGPATLHEGEMVLPVPVAQFFRREGLPVQNSDAAPVVIEIRRLRENAEQQTDELRAELRRIDRSVTALEGTVGRPIQTELRRERQTIQSRQRTGTSG